MRLGASFLVVGSTCSLVESSALPSQFVCFAEFCVLCSFASVSSLERMFIFLAMFLYHPLGEGDDSLLDREKNALGSSLSPR